MLFEGILCSLPLVDCHCSCDARLPRCRPFRCQLVCYTSICGELGVEAVGPGPPDFAGDVPGHTFRAVDGRDPVLPDASRCRIVFGPDRVGQRAKLVWVEGRPGNEMHVVVVVVTATMGKAPALNAAARGCGLAIDHPVQLVPV